MKISDHPTSLTIAMPVDVIQPILAVTFLAVWAMAGAILVREPK